MENLCSSLLLGADSGNITRKKRQENASRAARYKPQYASAIELFEETVGRPIYSFLEGSLCRHVDWDHLPEGCTLDASHLPAGRLKRKKVQLDNMFCHVAHLVSLWKVKQGTNKRRLTIVEFCGGTGSLALPLSATFPEIDVTMVDNKAESLLIAIERTKRSGLKNIRVVDCGIDNFSIPDGTTDLIGVSLHACGSLSCTVIKKCIAARAFGLVIAPCCIGKILHTRTSPLSAAYRLHLRGQAEFCSVVRAGDFAHANEFDTSKDAARRNCKSHVEHDREKYLVESGYTTVLTVMTGGESSPKNDILVACLDASSSRGYLKMA